MKSFLPRDISNTGRFVRALVAVFDWLFVRRDVERIFQYRQQRLKDIFSFTETLVAKVPFQNAIHQPLRDGEMF